MPRSKDGGGFSGPLSVIAVVTIALGVVVMVMAVSILGGFKGEIAGKVVGFGSHLTVSNYASSPIYQETPVVVDSALIAKIKAVDGVRHLQFFATKGGMVKTSEQIYGIMLRGLSANYDTSFFSGCMVEGITDDGDYLVPDSRCCYFHRHIGEDAVRAVADSAIEKRRYDHV